jgi:hypothetical protein
VGIIGSSIKRAVVFDAPGDPQVREFRFSFAESPSGSAALGFTFFVGGDVKPHPSRVPVLVVMHEHPVEMASNVTSS